VVWPLLLAAALTGLTACAPQPIASTDAPAEAPPTLRAAATTAPTPDPRVGLDAGLFDAEEAIWNLRALSQTPRSGPPGRGVLRSIPSTGAHG
jgi:hypothetical protein